MSDTKDHKAASATSRIDLTLFPATAVAYGALAMTEGDLKYGGYNYRATEVSASVYVAAAKRHLDKWYEGEFCDPRTLVPHLASVIASIAILIDATIGESLIDDRPPTRMDANAFYDDLAQRVQYLQSLYPQQHLRQQRNGMT